jgi:hypothetical protein
MARGLDVGTCFLVCASQGEEDGVKINSIRDAFLDIEADQATLNMLKMSSVSFVKGDENSDQIFIVGEPALNMANLFKREARRPLSKGVIAAGDLDAERMLVLLLKNILGEPSVEDEVVYYSIPAAPVDSSKDILYHEAMFKKIIESLGYRAVSMNEAAAIVYSNCSKEMFTALSSSFGAGMVNTSFVYQTMVGMSFSLETSGDWIDQQSAGAVGSTATKMMSIKEKGVNLLDAYDGDPRYIREREAIIVYYKNLIHNVIDTVKREFKRDEVGIEIGDGIPWVIGGGTTKAKNFLEFFKKEFETIKDFPTNFVRTIYESKFTRSYKDSTF